jgi:hypothetical protein
MRRKRCNRAAGFNRHWLLGAVVSLAIIFTTINCSFENNSISDYGDAAVPKESIEAAGLSFEEPQTDPGLPDGGTEVLSSELWADVSDAVTTPRPTHSTSERISLNVKDANLLDVLSMLAYKLDANIIFLEEPSLITIKTEQLSPITTFQIVLQKAGLDYLAIGRNYLVGERDRLYDDFTNRMFLCRFNLFYVSASAMEEYIEELGMPLHSLAVDSNQKALWMQGTPMALGKARELINTLDVMENADYRFSQDQRILSYSGGERKIRMPVTSAFGPRAEEELEALIDLLSILLDGFREGRVEMGWVTWNHPDPVPSIYMDWDNPVIKPYDIKMKITRDFANDPNGQIRYLIAEGTPDTIEMVLQMIDAIRTTAPSPLFFQGVEEITNDETGNNDSDNTGTTQWTVPVPQGGNVQSYSVTLNGVPLAGGRLSGSGEYSEGAMVTVTAVPGEGYQFVRWIENGAQMSTSTSYSFKIYRNTSLEAVFISSGSENRTESPPADSPGEDHN